MSDLIDYLKQKGLPLSTDTLQKNVVHINNSDFTSYKKWPIYRCLYTELTVGEERYMLRNGLWYKVDSDFVATVDRSLASLKTYADTLPLYSQRREEDYNAHCADTDSTLELMDKKNTKIGGPHDKIEFCDLIKSGRDFIHVKYYRSSATLSHLFAQGCVASEAFVGDIGFRQRLNTKLPASCRLKDAEERPDPKNYQVVYAIATHKKIPEELPFFSKVILKNALKTLRALDYDVALARIPVDPELAKIKTLKAEKAKKLL